MIRAAVLFATLATTAGAETLHFACDFPNGKRVEITHTDTTATYSFGTPGGLDDLTIIRPVSQVHLTPWPGIGRTIWEEVTFLNDGHSYTIHASIHRIYPDDDEGEIEVEFAGGIIVQNGEAELAHLTCLPDTVDFPWGTGLFDAKEKAGQCYDHTSLSLGAC